MHHNIESKLADVLENIDIACSNSQQAVQDITLIAVSKLQSMEVIEEAYGFGLKNFGENYAQELSQKAISCHQDIVWHFIGPIQTNKVRLIAESADWVHSVDRVKVAKKLDEACRSINKIMSVLIQVNIDDEPSKSGVKSEDVLTFAQEVNSHYPNLELKGLMFMPKMNASTQDKLKTYTKIKTLQNSVLQTLPHCKEISLGTSGDYEQAIEAGSSMVRIGETLLGPR